MKDRLRQLIADVLQDCHRRNLLHSGAAPDIVLDSPSRPEHGDLATNLAMVLAKEEKKAPRLIAEILKDALGDGGGLLEKIEIAGPGFINFFFVRSCWYDVLDEVAEKGREFGRSSVGKGTRVQVEFVSANPTGPLHIGHGRGAATGDAVASVLEAAGYEVQREYYINDAGNQVTLLGRSIWLRLRELLGDSVDFPEDGYKGDYIREIARDLLSEKGDEIAMLPESAAVETCGLFGMQTVLTWIRRDLQEFGVRFDNWYSERSLYERDLVSLELDKLHRHGLTYESEGALWFRTTAYGDDKDRVLTRSDGTPTYFASDVAYHMEKYDRGFHRVIDVWGADHHGYIPRMKAVLSGLGHAPEDLQVLLIQMVNLLRGGEPVTMGKRSGEFVTLRDVVDEVGRDACRFFFLMRRSDSQLDFDLDLAKEQSSDNPVFYVQYAHARICSINRNAAEQGIEIPKRGTVDFAALSLDEELALAKALARYPEAVENAARLLEPHRIVFYLQELAALFHSYYNRQRVLTEDLNLSRSRLYLVNSVRTVLANALRLLGVSTPEKM